MIGQQNLFQTEPAIQEIWICQRTIMLGARTKVERGDSVVIIDRYRDRRFDLDMIVILHNSKRVESIQSFFEKHFYILTKGKK